MLKNVGEADEQLRRLRSLEIDLDDITEKLQLDGIAAFAAAYDKVLAARDKKSDGIIARKPDRQPLEHL